MFADLPHIHLYWPFTYQSVPLRPLYTRITGLTQNSSCKSSHVSPCLNLKDLLSPCFFLLCLPFTNPKSVCPSLHGHSRELFLPYTAMNKESEVDSFLPAAAAATCLLNFNLSVGAIPRPALPTLSRGPGQFSTASSLRSSCNSFENALFLLMSENLTLHFFLLAFSFAPNLLTLSSSPFQAFQHDLPSSLLPPCCIHVTFLTNNQTRQSSS